MSSRRSLTAGINTPQGVDPELALAFIKQEPHPTGVPRRGPVETDVPEYIENEQPPRPSGSASNRRTHKANNKLLPVGLIPVTVRLRPQIAGALKRASLERQLHGEEVYTQQDLVEQVLEPWLHTNGYLGD